MFSLFLRQQIRAQIGDSGRRILRNRWQIAGEIIECGMGYYSKVQIVEAPGYIFKGDTVPTPEDIRDHWEAISDMEGALPYPGADDVIRAVFGKLKASEEL